MSGGGEWAQGGYEECMWISGGLTFVCFLICGGHIGTVSRKSFPGFNTQKTLLTSRLLSLSLSVFVSFLSFSFSFSSVFSFLSFLFPVIALI